MFDVKAALHELVAKEGSDLHLKVGSSPLFRVQGELTLDAGAATLERGDTEQALRDLLSDESKLEEFDQDHEVDFSYEIEGVARFRINAFSQRGTTSAISLFFLRQAARGTARRMLVPARQPAGR